MSERRSRGRPKAFSDRTEQNTIQSLDRAMRILEALAVRENQTLSELAAMLDQSPATVYRVLVTLAQREIVETDEAAQTWHVGPGAFRIGSAFLRRTSVLERARPAMHRLMEASGETANLGIARQTEVVFVSQVETHHSIRAFFPPGTTSPLHASGIGKALLSARGQAAPLPDMELTRFTHHTLTDIAALTADLARTRSRGYAIDNEERTEGMRCIAAAILNATGDPVAGISVSGPVSRMTDMRLPALGDLVRDAAAEVSRSMGAAA